MADVFSGAGTALARWISVPQGARRALLAAAAVLSLAFAAALYGVLAQGSSTAPARLSSSGGVSSTAGSSAPKGLLSLPLAAQGPASAALGAANPAYTVTGHGARLSARTPAQQLSSAFTASGVAVSSPGARLELGLRAIGYGSSLAPLRTVAPRAQGNRVLYERPGLTESYTNGPLGLEQGFTVSQAPAGAAAGPLTLSLAFAADARATLARGGRVVTLSRGGHQLLRYTGLRVTDARGRQLPSRIELGRHSLLLRVDAVNASYPLQVDPFVRQGPELMGGGETGMGRFGASVALSENGSTALVGGYRDSSEAGAAWVFTRSGGTWTQQGSKLTGTGETGAGRFGASVALSGDGNTAVIGGYNDSSGAGAAWVFTRSGGTWTQQGSKLTGAGETGAARFGYGVALSGDGKTALVGGYRDSTETGAAWVFSRSGETFSQQGAKLTGSGETGEGQFGMAVALSGNGNIALIGGPGDGAEVGAAWAFARTGESWSQQGSKLTATGETGKGEFGISVALSAEATTALIGGPSDSGESGAAWAFTRSGETWTQQGSKLTGEGEQGKGLFGASVALSGDGNTALVGGYEDAVEMGAAWVFTRAAETWTQQGSKLVNEEEEAPAGEFGDSVALSGDGSTALVGARFDHSGAGGAWAYFNAGPVPIVVTGEAAFIGGTSATLTATVNPDGENVTDCHFEYGTSAEYGTSVPCSSSPGSGTSAVPVLANVSGLTTGTLYHFRISATNATGTSVGHDATFTPVAGPAPVVSKISPNKGPVTGGTSVTISGSHFTNATGVKFGSVEVAPGAVLDSSITVVSPPNTSATVNVQVTTPSGTSAPVKKDSFKYGKPSVTGVSPKFGSKAGGASVTVTGTGFALGSGTVFMFKKTPATGVNCTSTTECTVTTPASSSTKGGPVDVVAVIGKNKSPKNPPSDQYTYE
jgi:hypothetical protein